jgi:hypothetical protein
MGGWAEARGHCVLFACSVLAVCDVKGETRGDKVLWMCGLVTARSNCSCRAAGGYELRPPVLPLP